MKVFIIIAFEYRIFLSIFSLSRAPTLIGIFYMIFEYDLSVEYLN